MINKKYGKRIITVIQDIEGVQRSIIKLNLFKSLLHLSVEKELPILLYKNSEERSLVFFIGDGDCIYSYESTDRELLKNTKLGTALSNAYVES